ncbi:ABC transporter substrate-binding protein [Pseudonocardia acaciae]|uniref:ABC transporter substrate-binding protein n=1 Tax=Pseudonocardia acaciae TaxID=551276 RepID=UPI0012EDC7C9|nr:ABC transporter substrate-binding protein [Pseudonocardia acaciae]
MTVRSTQRPGRLRRWWGNRSRRVRKILVALLVFILVAALVAISITIWINRTYCDYPDLKRAEGPCVGISDGTDSQVFGPGAANALRVIGEENTRLANEHPAEPTVSVAYVVPLPPPGVDDSYAARLAGDLMGVAVAQRQANRTNTAGGRPLIRVLVVNVGDSANPSAEPIARLIEMAHAEFAKHHLMAVAVTGKSLRPLTALIETMVTAEIPVVISHLTADQLLPAPATPNTSLARIAPTTEDEAAAAAAYLRSSSKRALIVQNTDPDDRYSLSLGAAFRARYVDAGHAVVEPDETYNGQRNPVGAMKGIVLNICQQRPDVVFFAGRAPELAALASALPTRPCLDLPVRVVTGDDGAQFVAMLAGGVPELRRGMEANASVEFTALAHPEAWGKAPWAFTAGSTEYLTGRCAECFPTLFPNQTLDDSYAIMAYDAMMATIGGIRSPYGEVRSPRDLIGQFKLMHGAGLVAGASGWISLTSTGSAVNKAVAILRAAPDGRTQFVQLSSPSGTPCTPGMPGC